MATFTTSQGGVSMYRPSCMMAWVISSNRDWSSNSTRRGRSHLTSTSPPTTQVNSTAIAEPPERCDACNARAMLSSIVNLHSSVMGVA